MRRIYTQISPEKIGSSSWTKAVREGICWQGILLWLKPDEYDNSIPRIDSRSDVTFFLKDAFCQNKHSLCLMCFGNPSPSVAHSVGTGIMNQFSEFNNKSIQKHETLNNNISGYIFLVESVE